MSGNVAEWEDACYVSSGPATDHGCDVRGGNYGSNPAGDLTCDAVLFEPRKNIHPRLGFRCCSK